MFWCPNGTQIRNPGYPKPSWYPNPNADQIWDLTAEKELEENDDGSPHDLAVIRHLLALKIIKHDDRPRTETYEGTSPSDWMKEGTCLACSCGIEGNVCGTGH